MRATTTEICYSTASDDALKVTIEEIRHNIQSLYSLWPPIPKKAPRTILCQIRRLSKEGHVVLAELNYRKKVGVPRDFKPKPKTTYRYGFYRSTTRRA